uniref:kinesin-like protein KIF7 n=1 Tax=Myxine glutinosa TaxID=7769 RepID=UPI00358FD4AD
MNAVKASVQKMQCQQEERDHFTSLEIQSEQHLHELESNLELMRRQYAVLKQKLWEEAQHKLILDSEIRHMEVEQKKKQQQNVQQVQVNSDGHNGNVEGSVNCTKEQQRLDEQRRWLDGEVEKALEERHKLRELQQALVQREEELMWREALLQEKEQLEIKRIQSSQTLSNDQLRMSSLLLSLDESKASVSDTGRISGKTLEQNHLELLAQRAEVEVKLQKGNVLSKEDEHYLLQLDEAIESLDATIAYRNEVLSSRQTAPKDPTAVLRQSWDNIMGHLANLATKETHHLLCKYFDKVVLLQEEKRHLQLSCSLLEAKAEESERLVAELQVAMQNLSLENERKLTTQQSEHDCSLQLFMNHASTAHSLPAAGESESSTVIKYYEDKVQQLQKDLVFYKCTSRELKRKLQKTFPESRRSQRASTSLPDALTSDHPSLGEEVQPDRSDDIDHGQEEVKDGTLSSSISKSNMAEHSSSVSGNEAISHLPPQRAAPVPVRKLWREPRQVPISKIKARRSGIVHKPEAPQDP